MKVDDYRQQAPFRASAIENSPITLSVVDRRRAEGPDLEYALNPVAHSAVSRIGSVLPLPFLSVVDRKTIPVLTTGNQYDIW